MPASCGACIQATRADATLRMKDVGVYFSPAQLERELVMPLLQAQYGPDLRSHGYGLGATGAGAGSLCQRVTATEKEVAEHNSQKVTCLVVFLNHPSTWIRLLLVE